MYERNFYWENLTVQLTVLRSKQKLLPEETKLTKQLLVLPATNATSARSFSAIKRIKMYLRNTASGNRLRKI